MTTIGIAVELPRPHALDLQDYRLSLGDGSGEGIPAHITLLGPVDLAPELMDDVVSHLTDVAARHAPFSVALRGTDTFRPVSPVVFLRVADGAESCARLAEGVRQGPLGVDLAYPYHPHVTLAHGITEEKLDRAEADYVEFSLDFPVSSFRVYQLDRDRGWVALLDLTLTGGA